MIARIRRAIDRRRSLKQTVREMMERNEVGAWSLAKERAHNATDGEERAFWNGVVSRIETLEDRKGMKHRAKRRPAR